MRACERRGFRHRGGLCLFTRSPKSSDHKSKTLAPVPSTTHAPLSPAISTCVRHRPTLCVERRSAISDLGPLCRRTRISSRRRSWRWATRCRPLHGAVQPVRADQLDELTVNMLTADPRTDDGWWLLSANRLCSPRPVGAGHDAVEPRGEPVLSGSQAIAITHDPPVAPAKAGAAVGLFQRFRVNR